MSPSFLSIRSIFLLGALWNSVSAEVGPLVKRSALLSPRACQNPSWIPVCPGAFPCIPPGGICCSDDITFVMPPDTCPDGTQPVATAIISDVVPTTTPAPATTPAPVSTPPPAVEYTWYTWTFTYYYYYYYYYINELTSTQTIYYTTVSLTATNEGEASSLFASLSATLSYQIPTQTSTPTSNSEPTATSKPAATSQLAVTTYPTAPSYTSNAAVHSSAPPVPFTGAAASLRIGVASYFGNFFLLATGALMVTPGLLMLWL